MQPQVRSFVDGWIDAFNAGRADDLVALYAPDARVVPPGRPAMKGHEELRVYYAEIHARGFKDYAVDIDDIVTRDGFLFASGLWGLTGPGSGGARQRFGGNWLNVLHRGTGTWRIVTHMWN